MTKLDRLSSVLGRFELVVRPAPASEASLLLWRQPGDGGWLLQLSPYAPLCTADRPRNAPSFSAAFSWGGRDNPLISALPTCVERRIAPGEELDMLATLLAAEQTAARCGAATVVNRLGEVLIVRMLREQMAQGVAHPGVLRALSDPRLARAVVAMHENPGRDWRNEDLAEIAGLSRSRFAELFTEAVSEGPSAYLRRWRLSLARRDLERGQRVQTVARRYGYRSAEAMSRAFQRAYGMSPRNVRKFNGEALASLPNAASKP
ncbi:MAG: AraC family transcriptional regulator [Neomegalonema sp.]|nr:AraC family transcriptional regulator [Neomegalonema sp.]